MNKQIILGIVGLLVIAGAFYGGMTYAKSKIPARGQFGNGQFVANGQLPGGDARGGMNGGFTSGEIISKDASSITIKMQDGSTKIVLVSGSTQVMKTASGNLSDLINGTNVVITGSTNSDGSITGQSIQIRPASTTTMFINGGKTQ